MNDFGTAIVEKPSKLVPVLIGGAAIAAVSALPVISMLNILCCSGVMIGAVLGVWFYKKNFPASIPFSVGDGAIIGTLSGMVGGALLAVISSLTLGIFSAEFQNRIETEIERALQQSSFQDPATADQVRELLTQLAASPFILFLVLLIALMIIFTLFGLFGGLIGGGIFKTRTLPMPPQTPPVQPPAQF
jgi:hypothetical protein